MDPLAQRVASRWKAAAPDTQRQREKLFSDAWGWVLHAFNEVGETRSKLIGLVSREDTRDTLGEMQQDFERQVLRPMADADDALVKVRQGLHQLFDKAHHTKTAAMGDSVKADLRKALEAIDYMPNAVAAWMDAHGGDRHLANENAKKIRQAQDMLGEVLASLPNAVEYVVFGVDPKAPRLDFKTKEDLIRGLARYKLKPSGEFSGGGVRPELRGQPLFNALVGPMYGGPGLLRYESGEVHERLSR